MVIGTPKARGNRRVRKMGNMRRTLVFCLLAVVLAAVACENESENRATSIATTEAAAPKATLAPTTNAAPTPTSEPPAPTEPATQPDVTPESGSQPSPTPPPVVETPPAIAPPAAAIPPATTPGPDPDPTSTPAPRPPTSDEPPSVQPPPDTSTFLADRASSINARVVGLNFFESPALETSFGDRVYRTVFDQDTTRYISWEFTLAYPANRSQIDFKFDSVVRDAAGSIIEHYSSSTNIEPEWTGSYHQARRGESSPGSWEPGWYSVTVSVDDQVVATRWFQVTSPAGASLAQLEQQLGGAISWLYSVTGPSEELARSALLRVWDKDAELAESIGGLSWVADGMSSREPAVLEQLATLADLNRDAARVMVAWPWVEDGVGDTEWQALRNLAGLGVADPEILLDVVQYHWVADGINDNESIPLKYLAVLAGGDQPEIPATSWPWVQDGITEVERWALQALSRLTESDAALGLAVQGLPWVSDDMREDERWGLRGLSSLVDWDFELAKLVAAYPWFADGTTETEWRTLDSLGGLVLVSNDLANVAARYSWAADEISEDERWALATLVAISDGDLAFAQEIADMEFLEAPFRARDRYALASIWQLMALPDDLASLTGQTWFADGLNDEDAAFVAMLADINARDPSQFRDFVQSHYARTSTVDLPLAGQVDLAAFRLTPFQRFDDILDLVEDSLRATEQFMGVPFPQKDVLLLFIDPLYEWPAVNDASIAFNIGGRHMLVTRQEVIEGDYRGAVAHEVSHYYWNANAPLWLIEGGADFLSSFVLDWNGYRQLADRKTTLGSIDVAGVCKGRGVENLQRLIDLLEELGYAAHADSSQFYCNYAVGEYFLINVYDTLGPEAAGAGLAGALLAGRAGKQGRHGDRDLSGVPAQYTSGKRGRFQ